MRPFVILGILFAAVFFLASEARAADCRRRVIVREVEQIITPAVVTQFVPFAVQVPTYSVGYQSSLTTQQTEQPTAALNELALQIGTLRQQLAACEAALRECQRTHPAPGTPVPLPVPTPVHVPSPVPAPILVPTPTPTPAPVPTPIVAPPPAPAPSSLSLAPLTPEQILKVFRLTNLGQMPKGGSPLVETELALVNQWVGDGVSTPELAKLFTAKCASCHASSVAAARGKNFTLLR